MNSPFSDSLFHHRLLSDNPAVKMLHRAVDAADEAAVKFRHQLEYLWAGNKAVNDAQMSTLFDMMDSYRVILEQLALHPVKTSKREIRLLKDQSRLIINSARRALGQEVEPVISPAKGDRRFAHEDWNENLLFDYIKQAYLINATAILELVDQLEDTRTHSHAEFVFYTRQLVNALSPSNLPVLNPEVLRKIQETKGMSILDGARNLWEDYRNNPGLLNITMTDYSAFEVGSNIATTPGKVIYQNDLMQLIQYEPTTDKVFKTPLLIIPPWINKYYILDLKPKNSFIKWAVDQGHTVFIASWKNPGPDMASVQFEDYMSQGSLEAIRVVKEATDEEALNVIGYCIGGTLLGCTLAYLHAHGQADQIKSATYLTTLLDFSDPGEIGVFINEHTISNIEKFLDKTGYFDGRAMAFSFNMLRENDLYWAYFVNNYLKGEKPPAFDLLYWNSDGTNLPAAMQKYYLRHMYLENRLIQPGGITLKNTPIDLGKITTPCYFLSAEQDHIAKWNSTYNGAKAHSGEVTFVLSGSGHIAGVVNPPTAGKYGYRTFNPKALLPQESEEWFEHSTKHEGSWWPHWQKWIKPRAGRKITARHPDNGLLPVLENAPGSYVKQRIAEVITP
ncbi:PHA/PHB synthase family protein [Hahella ganghwensis]|uniref:PHA/PHB synthase family protein n=1 Tax=Hahella ganghwensis TaxID=286420 RepID=UPI00037DEE9F|nr:class I poly(R)-hydroxyalkanoic acid synthase [Hahella ganghwensis]